MSEVIQLQVGQCGNRIGARFWEMLCAEHGLTSSGSPVSDSPALAYGRSVYFSECADHTFRPRSLLIDLDCGALDSIRAQSCGRLFPSDNYVVDNSGTGNLYAKGYYGDGQELHYLVEDAVRRLAESCDSLSCFQLVHSIGGGTGSGLGSLILQNLRCDYPCELISVYTLFPSQQVSDVIVEPYNAVLAINTLIQYVELVFGFENEAVFTALGTKNGGGYEDVNSVIAEAAGGITSGGRFAGALNCSMRKLAVNLVPFFRLHFCSVKHTPTQLESELSRRAALPGVIEALFGSGYSLSNMGNEREIVLAAAALFQGRISLSELDIELASIRGRFPEFRKIWASEAISSFISKHDEGVSATLLMNSSGIQHCLDNVLRQFWRLYRKKVYLGWYKAEGMEEVEFENAEYDVNTLMREYQTMEGGGGSEEDEEEEEVE